MDYLGSHNGSTNTLLLSESILKNPPSPDKPRYCTREPAESMAHQEYAVVGQYGFRL